MGSIKDRVAIIGMGCTKFGENWDQSGDDMIVDATYEALEDAGVEMKDIEAAWYGCTQSSRGGPKLAYALKLEYKPVTRVENHCVTGTDALRNAAYAVAAGMYDIALVVGYEKLKDLGLSGLPVWPEIADSQVRPFLPPPFQFALSALLLNVVYGKVFTQFHSRLELHSQRANGINIALYSLER